MIGKWTLLILFIIAMGELVVIFYLLEKIRKLTIENRYQRMRGWED